MPRTLSIGMLVLVLALVVACGGSASDNDPAPDASTAVEGAIEVTMKDTMKFEPSTLTVQSGDEVVILLDNRGAIPHNFTIEAVGVDVTLDAKKSDTIEFTAPTDPGEYEITCTEPGHENAGMVGTLIVER